MFFLGRKAALLGISDKIGHLLSWKNQNTISPNDRFGLKFQNVFISILECIGSLEIATCLIKILPDDFGTE